MRLIFYTSVDFVVHHCFNTVGWTMLPVKNRPQNDLSCVGWDVNPYLLTLANRKVLLLKLRLLDGVLCCNTRMK